MRSTLPPRFQVGRGGALMKQRMTRVATKVPAAGFQQVALGVSSDSKMLTNVSRVARQNSSIVGVLDQLRNEAARISKTRALTTACLKASKSRLDAAKCTRNKLLQTASRYEVAMAAFKQRQEKVTRHTSSYEKAKRTLEQVSENQCQDGKGAKFLSQLSGFINTASQFVDKLSCATCHVRDGLECVRLANERIKHKSSQKKDALARMTEELDGLSIKIKNKDKELDESKTNLDAMRVQTKALLSELQGARVHMNDLMATAQDQQREVVRLEKIHKELVEQKSIQIMTHDKLSARTQTVSDAEKQVATLLSKAQILSQKLAESRSSLARDRTTIESLVEAITREQATQDSLDTKLQVRFV